MAQPAALSSEWNIISKFIHTQQIKMSFEGCEIATGTRWQDIRRLLEAERSRHAFAVSLTGAVEDPSCRSKLIVLVKVKTAVPLVLQAQWMYSKSIRSDFHSLANVETEKWNGLIRIKLEKELRKSPNSTSLPESHSNACTSRFWGLVEDWSHYFFHLQALSAR